MACGAICSITGHPRSCVPGPTDREPRTLSDRRAGSTRDILKLDQALAGRRQGRRRQLDKGRLPRADKQSASDTLPRATLRKNIVAIPEVGVAWPHVCIYCKSMIRTLPASTVHFTALSLTVKASVGNKRSRAEEIGTRARMVIARFSR